MLIIIAAIIIGCFFHSFSLGIAVVLIGLALEGGRR